MTKENDALLKIVIADDHAIIRMGVKFLLKENFQNIEIYEASNGNELYEMTKKHDPHIVLMDLHMPDTDSQATLRNLLLLKPKLNVLVFSVNKEEIYGKLYLKLGASGYIQKDLSPDELMVAIRCVRSGNLYMRKEMKSFYLDSHTNDETSVYASLSKKEMEILHFINRGDSGINIAKMMNLSTSTIGTHKASIFIKLHVNNIVELKEVTTLHPLSN